MNLFTIGHSNHEPAAFTALLKQHGVTALADVRSHPYSRHLPHFNKAPLDALLQEVGVRYVFLGDQLGARPNDADCYVNGKALYERIAATERFAMGLQRILHGLESYTIALMCAEQDPITCHRAILVCHHLNQVASLNIRHILKDGELESHTQLENRLLKLHKLEQEVSEICQLGLFDLHVPQSTNLFQVKESAIATAYQLQGDRIAYVEKTAHEYEPVR